MGSSTPHQYGVGPSIEELAKDYNKMKIVLILVILIELISSHQTTDDRSQPSCTTRLCSLLQQREMMDQFKKEKRLSGMEFVGKRSYSYNIPVLSWNGRIETSPGIEMVMKRAPGMEFVGKRAPGMEFDGKGAPEMEFVGKQAPGMEFMGKLVPGMEFVEKRSSIKDLVEKRAPGMEFVGKRAFPPIQIRKRIPGMEFVG